MNKYYIKTTEENYKELNNILHKHLTYYKEYLKSWKVYPNSNFYYPQYNDCSHSNTTIHNGCKEISLYELKRILNLTNYYFY